jgi:cytochrome b6-f complex iron-sulfur subunit
MHAGRRRVLNGLWMALGGALAVQAAWVAVSFLRPRKSTAERSPLFVAGPVEQFTPGTVTAFPSGKFYLARIDDGGFLAMHMACTHLGCTVVWDPGRRQFLCPCHASAFTLSGGVLSAPAPRPLDLHPVRVENGIVKVDLERRQTRQSAEPSQASRP